MTKIIIDNRSKQPDELAVSAVHTVMRRAEGRDYEFHTHFQDISVTAIRFVIASPVRTGILRQKRLPKMKEWLRLN